MLKQAKQASRVVLALALAGAVGAYLATMGIGKAAGENINRSEQVKHMQEERIASNRDR